MMDGLKPIDGRVLDRKRLSNSPDLINQLSDRNVGLSTQDFSKLESFIKGTPGFLDTMFQANCSTHENPNIIFEHGASYCSLLVASDEEGNVVSLHLPIVGYSKLEIEQELNLTGFIPLLNENIASKRTIFITATGAGTTIEERAELIRNLEEIFGQKVRFLFLERESRTSEQVSLRSKLSLIVRNLFQGRTDENLRLRSISNVFIVPSVCSTTGKTEIIIPSYPRGRIDQLKSAIGDIKMKLYRN